MTKNNSPLSFSMNWKFSSKAIREAADKLVESTHPEKIILFGSYAYGKPHKNSDIDFLLVSRASTKKEKKLIYLKASRALIPRPFPVDIVVRSSKEIEQRIRQGDYFLKDILDKGKTLYEK